MPTFLSSRDADFDARFAALLGMKREEAEDVDLAVAAIIADVRARGDAAVLELTAKTRGRGRRVGGGPAAPEPAGGGGGRRLRRRGFMCRAGLQPIRLRF